MYPEDWKETAQRKKDLVGWKCEKCGHPHELESGHVLTVHHINGLPYDNRDDNLVALCQRCHLRVQSKAVGIRSRQLKLFP